jgi:hypothetical protein
METYIQIKLFATLQPFMPPSGEKYPINPGISIRNLLERLNVPQEKAKLILYEDGKPRDSGGNSRVAMKGGVCVEKFLYYERRQSL